MQPSAAKKRKADESSSGGPTYQLDETILCKFSDGHDYKAKILKVSQKGYEIHYQGWNKRYDETISEEDSKKRFKKFNEDDEKKAKEKIKQARTSSISIAPEPPKKSASKEKKRTVEAKSSSKSSSVAFSSLDTLIDEELAYILCEENEKIIKQKRRPKHPAEPNIEQITIEFLLSKNYNNGNAFKAELTDSENFLPQSSQYSEVVACLIKIFNITFHHSLVYEQEKPFFEEFNKEHSDQKIKRYSSSLGITHLLRFFTRLPDIIQKIPTTNELSLKYLSNGASDFCKFLSGTASKYYTEAYYDA